MGQQCCAAPTKVRVIKLNVYNLGTANSFLSKFGGGLYHTAVEVDGLEISFANGSGVTHARPLWQDLQHTHVPGVTLAEVIEMGNIRTTADEWNAFINRISIDFPGHTYNLTNKNCNHFTNDFCMRLGLGPIPERVNKLSTVAEKGKGVIGAIASIFS